MTRYSVGRVELPDGHLVYRRSGGNKPPALLLHGLTDNGLCWARAAESLVADHDLVLLDARGHGESSALAGQGVEDPAADIAAVVAALELDAPLIIGHSVGATAAARFAGRFPALVSRVILEDPPLREMPTAEAATQNGEAAMLPAQIDGFRGQVEQYRAMSLDELLALGRRRHPTWHEDDYPDWAMAKQQVDPQVLAHLRFPPWRPLLASLAAPTLLMFAAPGRDGLVTEAIAAEAIGLNPLISIAQVPEAGHNIRRENLAGWLSCVRAFLRAT